MAQLECDFAAGVGILEDLHYEADAGAGDVFRNLKTGTLADLKALNEYPACLERIELAVIIPHQMIKAVVIPALGIDLAYDGFNAMFRQLMSAKIQSTSMDFSKIAMTEFRKRAKARWPEKTKRPRLCNCIHDEIAVLCRECDAEEVSKILKDVMTSSDLYRRYLAHGAKLQVDIDAEVGRGKTYAEAKP